MKFVGKFSVKEMERCNKGGFVVKGVTHFTRWSYDEVVGGGDIIL